MNNITEIISKYTNGEASLEDTNAELKAAGSRLYLDPQKNQLTAEEIAETTVGATPEDANGVGLLDTGTGTLDKVFVKNGKITNGDCGEMFALCVIGGMTYRVQSSALMQD